MDSTSAVLDVVYEVDIVSHGIFMVGLPLFGGLSCIVTCLMFHFSQGFFFLSVPREIYCIYVYITLILLQNQDHTSSKQQNTHAINLVMKYVLYFAYWYTALFIQGNKQNRTLTIRLFDFERSGQLFVYERNISWTQSSFADGSSEKKLSGQWMAP